VNKKKQKLLLAFLEAIASVLLNKKVEAIASCEAKAFPLYSFLFFRAIASNSVVWLNKKAFTLFLRAIALILEATSIGYFFSR
jgi:hypothetical protein